MDSFVDTLISFIKSKEKERKRLGGNRLMDLSLFTLICQI